MYREIKMTMLLTKVLDATGAIEEDGGGAALLDGGGGGGALLEGGGGDGEGAALFAGAVVGLSRDWAAASVV